MDNELNTNDKTSSLTVQQRPSEQAHKRDEFTAGYLIAVANIMHLHGDDVIARDVLTQLGADEDDMLSLDLTDYDAEQIRPLFKDLRVAS